MSTSAGNEKSNEANETGGEATRWLPLHTVVAKAPVRIVANIAPQKVKYGLAKFIDSLGTTYESVTVGGEPAFIFCKDSRFGIAELTDGFRHLVVPEMSHYALSELRESMRCPDKSNLYLNVYNLIEAYTGFEPIHCHILTATVMLSYMQDQFNVLPLISIYGGTGNSKTAALLILERLAYRPVLIDFANLAALESRGYNFRGDPVPCITTLLDEVDVADIEKLAILKMDTRWHSYVLKKTGQAVRNHFGLKVIAGTNPILDEAFQRRAITVHAISSKPKKDIFRDDEKQFSQLQTELLIWHMSATKIENATEIPDFQEFANYWRPLLLAARNTNGYGPLLEFFKNEFNRRKSSKGTTLEGEIATILQNFLGFPNRTWSFASLWYELLRSYGVADTSYQDKPVFVLPDGKRLSKIEVSKILSNVFDVTTKLGKEEDKIRRLLVFPKDLDRKLARYRYNPF